MASSVQGNPRIVIYGVGQYGQYIARFAAQKGWPVVAAYNRAGPKVGQDLGRVAGLDRDLGVIIQDCETADYAGLEADIGIVTQTNMLRVNLPAYKRLIGAGLNVLCHGSQSYYPFGCDAGLAAEIDALAKAHNVTFTGGGIWDMSRIWSGILVAGPCTSIKSLFHTSITDAAGQLANAQQAEQIGIGFSLEKFEQSGLRTSPMAIAYKTIPEQVLDALGFTISDTSAYIEPVVFDVPVAAAVPAGRDRAHVLVRRWHAAQPRAGGARRFRARHGVQPVQPYPGCDRRAAGGGGDLATRADEEYRAGVAALRRFRACHAGLASPIC
jgi:4-hydroxy-tetrahydrodipicolinate reductase